MGRGGREHALAWKLASSSKVQHVFVAPGNGGTALEKGVTNVEIEPMDFDGLTEFVRKEKIYLTVVGPEEPLVEGIVDFFSDQGLLCFGPSRDAARLEASKSFAKQFLKRHEIPTADFKVFETCEAAIEYVRKIEPPIVIKKDGLAAGKGVVIKESVKEAITAIEDLYRSPSEPVKRIVIEDFLEGEELSYIALVDGLKFRAFSTSQDYKRIYEGDRGPNTGGMGAYSPVSFVDELLEKKIVELIVKPTLKGMVEEGAAYRGFLYFGLMIDKKKNPHVVEYNCRFGDPETQPIMMRLESDLFGLLENTMEGRLDEMDLEFNPGTALTIVMASQGYPANYETGSIIKGTESVIDAKVFHSGTVLTGNRLLTSGGRVLGVTGLGTQFSDARTKAYDSIKKISFAGQQYRSDIGHMELKRIPK